MIKPAFFIGEPLIFDNIKIYPPKVKEVVAFMKEKGFTVYSAVLDETAQSISEITLGENTAVVIGNEGNGVSSAVTKACENKLYIPISGAESLNAAVAASIISWEMTRRQ